MRWLIPSTGVVAALLIISVLSGWWGTSVEPVTGPTTTGNAAQTTGSAAAIADAAPAAEAVKAADAAKAATAAKAAKAATAGKAKAAAATKAKVKATAVPPARPKQSSATLREACSKVGKAVSGLSGKSSPPTSPQVAAALAQVRLVYGAGDTETRSALSALLAALPGFRDEDPTGLANDGRRAFLDSLANLADRCEAEGSSALRWVG